MKKIERPDWGIMPGMEHVSSLGTGNVGGAGNRWNCGKPRHFSRNCPFSCYNQGNDGIPSQRA